MTTNLQQPFPSFVRLTESDGTMTQEWQNFFLDLYDRVGGRTASSITELETEDTSLQGQINTLDSDIDDLEVALLSGVYDASL